MTTSHTSSFSSIYLPLRLTYGLIPVLAGLDKFVELLADWDTYLPAFAADLLPMSPQAFMGVVGVIEIVAGLAVLTVLPRLGSYIVMAWLILIALVLVTAGHYDVAVRDLAMAVGAYTLGQVAALRGEAWVPGMGADDRAAGHLAHP